MTKVSSLSCFPTFGDKSPKIFSESFGRYGEKIKNCGFLYTCVTRFAIEKALQPMIAGVGLVGNMVNIIVFCRIDKKLTFNNSLIALAVVQILFLLDGNSQNDFWQIFVLPKCKF